MPIYTRSNSQGNFLGRASNDASKMIRQPPPNLITLPKGMYKIFNQFQLTQSRLWQIKQFQFLSQQIKRFNAELKQWKQNKISNIKNLRMTYYLYENLYTRIKFISGLSNDKQSAQKSLIQIIKWFNEQKPKARGAPPKKPQPILRQSGQNEEQQIELEDMTQYSLRKREMTPYEKMARTAHTNFFPPKERLLDYHKKEFIMDRKLTIDGEQARQLRLARTASLSRTNNMKLRQTSTTFQNTKTSFVKTSTVSFSNKNKSTANQTLSNFNQVTSQIKQQKQPQSQQLINQNIEIKQFTLLNEEGKQSEQININLQQGENKILEQQQMMKDVIDQPRFQEDEKDEEDEDVVEEELQQNKYKKTYEYDYKKNKASSSLEMQAQQNIKDSQQSTLRRILKQKQQQIEHKLQDLNIAQKMGNWAKTRSFINQQISRKSQSYRFGNQFNKTQYAKKGFFQKRKQIPQYELKSQRNKTVQNIKPRTIQEQFEKRRINEVMKKFGKYITPHVKLASVDVQNQQNEQIQMMRATSLTVFNKRGKHKQFGEILASNQIDIYNSEVDTDSLHIKQKLSKKQINVSRKKIYTALSAIKTQRLDEVKAFPKTLSLLSNPFFPKHLYETKKKKKK